MNEGEEREGENYVRETKGGKRGEGENYVKGETDENEG